MKKLFLGLIVCFAVSLFAHPLIANISSNKSYIENLNGIEIDASNKSYIENLNGIEIDASGDAIPLEIKLLGLFTIYEEINQLRQVIYILTLPQNEKFQTELIKEYLASRITYHDQMVQIYNEIAETISLDKFEYSGKPLPISLKTFAELINNLDKFI